MGSVKSDVEGNNVGTNEKVLVRGAADFSVLVEASSDSLGYGAETKDPEEKALKLATLENNCNSPRDTLSKEISEHESLKPLRKLAD